MKARFICAWLLFVSAKLFASDLKSDESLILFPSLARHHDEDGGYWTAEVHGWVYELDARHVLLPIFRRALGIDNAEMTTDERRIFADRARHFLADNERGDKIMVRIGDTFMRLGQSGPNGQFIGEIRFTQNEIEALLRANAATPGEVPCRAILPPKDARVIEGQLHVLGTNGLSVISDIDDTIKISNVTNHHELLRNTFVRPFVPVPGMADLYERWSTRDAAQFHYVSASPWQLYPSLAEFLSTNGFPSGSFHLKTFRWKDHTFFSLFGSPEKYKLGVIEPLLREFPHRRFVLVGDSGEKDPETYGELARRFPAQIQRIFIRNVTGQAANSPRHETAFRDVPAEKWRIFNDPLELGQETLAPP